MAEATESPQILHLDSAGTSQDGATLGAMTTRVDMEDFTAQGNQATGISAQAKVLDSTTKAQGSPALTTDSDIHHRLSVEGTTGRCDLMRPCCTRPSFM